MSANIYRRLVRPGGFLLLTGYWLILLRAAARHAPEQTGSNAFLWWGLILPLALGISLSTLVQEAMHRPFALLLPGARRGFPKSHGALVAVLALACGSVGYVLDRHLPVAALVCIAGCALSVSLPFEPGWRWAGSRIVALPITAALGASLWHWGIAREFVVGHPWPAAGAALMVGVLNFAVAFSPSRRRHRATTPWLPHFTAWGDANMAALRTRYEEVAGRTVSRRWKRERIGSSLREWIPAMRYERPAQWRGNMLPWSLLCTLGVGMAVHDAGGINNAFYQDLAAPLAAGRHPLEIYPYFLTLLLIAQRLQSPQTGRLYPISRARQATVAYAASLRQVAVNFSAVLASGAIVAGLTAAWTGLPFPLRTLAEFSVLLAAILPLMPFLQWGLLHHEVRHDRAVLLLVWLVGFAPLWLSRPVLRPAVPWLITPAGASAVLLLIAFSQWSYWAALRRFYREGDLLQGGTARRNFSLV